MDIVKEIIGLIKVLAWPITVLTITFMFRKSIAGILSTLLPQRNNPQRSLKLKMGQFELESQIIAKAKEQAEAIASEPDLKKRLAMAKEPFLVEEALKAINEKQLKALEELYRYKVDNAFYINWYAEQDGYDSAVYGELYKMGLIAGAPAAYGEEMAWFTPVGLAVLDNVRSSDPKTKR